MGRVDEALRRAAEEGRGEPAVATLPVAATATAFPEEAPAADIVRDAPGPTPTIAAPAEPILRAAPKDSKSGGGMATKLVGDDLMLTTSREQYRRLAATLHHLQAASGVKVILVASAVAGEGKTLTAANLALTFSASYEMRVLLIDADLRRPSLARTFGIPASPGLSDGLLRGHRGQLPLHQISPYLSVLPAGRAMPDPMAGLTSERLRQLITEARAAFDWVIIDTPPIGLMTDASLMSAIADGAVLVVKANATPYDLVRRAVEALGPGKLLGAVLNRATDIHRGNKYHDYYHYAPTPGKSAAR